MNFFGPMRARKDPKSIVRASAMARALTNAEQKEARKAEMEERASISRENRFTRRKKLDSLRRSKWNESTITLYENSKHEPFSTENVILGETTVEQLRDSLYEKLPTTNRPSNKSKLFFVHKGVRIEDTKLTLWDAGVRDKGNLYFLWYLSDPRFPPPDPTRPVYECEVPGCEYRSNDFGVVSNHEFVEHGIGVPPGIRVSPLRSRHSENTSIRAGRHSPSTARAGGKSIRRKSKKVV
jgi:hypothetical protein